MRRLDTRKKKQEQKIGIPVQSYLTSEGADFNQAILTDGIKLVSRTWWNFSAGAGHHAGFRAMWLQYILIFGTSENTSDEERRFSQDY